jgi:hypothetical protein
MEEQAYSAYSRGPCQMCGELGDEVFCFGDVRRIYYCDEHNEWKDEVFTPADEEYQPRSHQGLRWLFFRLWCRFVLRYYYVFKFRWGGGEWACYRAQRKQEEHSG